MNTTKNAGRKKKKSNRKALTSLEKKIRKRDISARCWNIKTMLVYILVGLFLLALDKIIENMFNPKEYGLLVDVVSGFLFVAVTSVINFSLLRDLKNARSQLDGINCEIEDTNRELEETNLILSAVLESSPDIIVFSLDSEYRYTGFNTMHQKRMDALIGKRIKKGMNVLKEIIEDDNDRKQAKEVFDRALNGEHFNFIQMCKNETNATEYWQNYYSPMIEKNGKVVGLTCFELNITALQEAEEQNRMLSNADQLTGLYNRRYYEENLDRIDCEKNYPLSVIVADVNGLKFTNDIFGHNAGDELIKTFSEILKQECRKDDMAARIGGDEFCILLPKTNAEQLKKIIKRIKVAASQKNPEKGILSVSFGGATKPGTDEKIVQFIKEADDLMYDEKILGRKAFENKLLEHIESHLYRDNITEQIHRNDVRELCKKLAVELGFTENQVDQAELAGALHDIGKVIIDRDILLKPDKLSDYEWKEVKRHSETGYKILNYFNRYRDISEFILYHHERIDGMGYPAGLKGNEIPVISKIIEIAEAFQSMTCNGVYQPVRSVKEAIEEIKRNTGTQFDETIARVFVEKVIGEKW